MEPYLKLKYNWTLWFHNPSDSNWGLDSYKKVKKVSAQSRECKKCANHTKPIPPHPPITYVTLNMLFPNLVSCLSIARGHFLLRCAMHMLPLCFPMPFQCFPMPFPHPSYAFDMQFLCSRNNTYQ